MVSGTYPIDCIVPLRIVGRAADPVALARSPFAKLA